MEQEIFLNLTHASRENGHFKVYNKKNLPTRWHANNPRRLGPILTVADIKYAFQDMIYTAQSYEQKFNVTSNDIIQYSQFTLFTSYKE